MTSLNVLPKCEIVGHTGKMVLQQVLLSYYQTELKLNHSISSNNIIVYAF